MARGAAAIALAVGGLAFPAAASAVGPRAVITDGPDRASAPVTATFAFSASGSALFASFQCSFDGASWSACTSPVSYTGVPGEHHAFAVRLQGVGADATPATWEWTIGGAIAPATASSPGTPPVASATPPAAVPRRPVVRRACASVHATADSASPVRLSRALACLLNRARRERGLRVLHLDGRLHRAAAGHAHDMLVHHFFGHVSSGGVRLRARVRSTGYLDRADRWMLGEALHWGEGWRSTPSAALSELLHSPHHRAILLSPALRDVGVAAVTYEVRSDGRSAATYVLDLGRRWR